MSRISKNFLKTVGSCFAILGTICVLLPLAVDCGFINNELNTIPDLSAMILTVTGVDQSTGTNNGSMTLKVTLNGTPVGVSLKKAGQSDITGTTPLPVGSVPPYNYNVTFDLTDKTTGYWDVVPNYGGGWGAALTNGFLITQALNSTSNIDNTTTTTLTLTPDSGHITLGIPANTFSQNVSLTVSTASVPSSDRETIKISNIGIEVTTDKNAQPDKAITITMYYRDSDIAGLDESKLAICRYDPLNNLWTPLPSTVYADQNKVVAQTDHLSKFALIQLAPAANISSVKVYPNPFNSKTQTQGLAIANLTATAEIKIYNVAGELVRKQDYTDGSGLVRWDGKNDGGSLVSSGVYIIYIKSDSGTKKIKVAVEK